MRDWRFLRAVAFISTPTLVAEDTPGESPQATTPSKNTNPNFNPDPNRNHNANPKFQPWVTLRALILYRRRRFINHLLTYLVFPGLSPGDNCLGGAISAFRRPYTACMYLTRQSLWQTCCIVGFDPLRWHPSISVFGHQRISIHLHTKDCVCGSSVCLVFVLVFHDCLGYEHTIDLEY